MTLALQQLVQAISINQQAILILTGTANSNPPKESSLVFFFVKYLVGAFNTYVLVFRSRKEHFDISKNNHESSDKVEILNFQILKQNISIQLPNSDHR